ncbi:MAG: DUF2905 domain-containing protein, partial [Candidatus Dadabacteria bacterium]
MNDLGKVLMIFGALIFLAGVLLIFLPPLFKWIGKLPGDILIKKDNATIFIPITSMIFISIVLTVLVNIVIY